MDNKLNIDKNNIDQINKILDTLSPTEKEAAISVLQQYTLTGHSDLLDDFILGDYAEIPVDIETFVDDPQYLRAAWYDGGGNCKLYPYWRKELHKLFPDNVTTAVNNTILSGSRGRGKTEVSILICAYMLYRVLCLKNPISFFHIKSTEKIVFAFMNIKQSLAEEIATSKFQNTIQSSPWFLAHGTIEGRTKKMWIPQKYADAQGNMRDVIDIKIGSQSDDLIGLPIYFAFFDEISFQRNQDVEKQKEKANDMIDTAIAGMKTRFVYHGKNPTMLVLASSKRSDKSFLEEHMKKKLKSEKENTYISDGSVWAVKPPGTYSDQTFNVALGNKFLQSMVIPDGDDPEEYIKKGYKILPVPIDFKADFLDDMDRSLCDYAGISSSSISKYISGAAYDECINDKIQNPFITPGDSGILTIGDGPDDADVQYYNFFDLKRVDPKLKNKPLFIHLDMSKTGDKTGIAGVFIKGKKPSTDPNLQSKDLFYSLAFSVSIKAPKGREISFEKNRQFIRWLKRQGFKIKGVTSDTFQSADLQQQLRAEGYPMDILSVDRVDSDKICKPYSAFKSAIYEHRFEFYPTKLLRQEVTDLERNLDSGKVDHPEDGCFTGDTKVSLTDGRKLSFLELIDEQNSGKINYVYSMNLDSKKIESKRIVKAWKTHENENLVKITLDNNEVIKCTLNHKFMLRNGSYIEAKDLLPGDSLMPLIKNCKVKSIEFIDERQDVYDIEVEDNHNFALASGIFVHNSKDQSDAVCGAMFTASQHAEEFAYDYGESAEDILKFNGDAEHDALQQMTVDLESELQRMYQAKHGGLMSNEQYKADMEKRHAEYEKYKLAEDIIII